MPPAGIAAALLLFWVLLTIGFSTEAQLEREGKRGGIRKGSDTAMRILSLPWHAVRAAAHALLRTVWFALIDVIVVTTLADAVHRRRMASSDPLSDRRPLVAHRAGCVVLGCGHMGIDRVPSQSTHTAPWRRGSGRRACRPQCPLIRNTIDLKFRSDRSASFS